MAGNGRRWIAWGAGAGGAGAAAAATASAACCVPIAAPLLVSALGVSGSIWAAGLKPWAPVLLALSGLLLAGGFWSLRSARERAAGAACAMSSRRRLVALPLWIGVAVWLVAVALNVVARWPGLLGG